MEDIETILTEIQGILTENLASISDTLTDIKSFLFSSLTWRMDEIYDVLEDATYNFLDEIQEGLDEFIDFWVYEIADNLDSIEWEIGSLYIDINEDAVSQLSELINELDRVMGNIQSEITILGETIEHEMKEAVESFIYELEDELGEVQLEIRMGGIELGEEISSQLEDISKELSNLVNELKNVSMGELEDQSEELSPSVLSSLLGSFFIGDTLLSLFRLDTSRIPEILKEMRAQIERFYSEEGKIKVIARKKR